MSQKIIRSKFTTTLAEYASSHNPVLLFSREGQPFTKPADGSTWLEMVITPSNTVTANVAGGRRRFYGDVQINIWTKESTGTGLAETIAEELSELFPRLPYDLFDPVFIESPTSIKRSLPSGDGWRITPVCISYRMEGADPVVSVIL